ncbi:MAG: hypothetical protein GY696_15415 [Gammaproteobacteria bacterium]|nr:hypothetical protein [Gammaproteobacteria bacterium]
MNSEYERALTERNDNILARATAELSLGRNDEATGTSSSSQELPGAEMSSSNALVEENSALRTHLWEVNRHLALEVQLLSC